jgi:hypothetical protein
MEEKMRFLKSVQTKSINSTRIESGTSVHEKRKQRPQKLLLLRCLLCSVCLDLGEGAEEEEDQGPKLVNKRLSSGCARLVGVTCQKQKTTTQNNVISTTLFGKNKKEYGIRTEDCIRICGGAPP